MIVKNLFVYPLKSGAGFDLETFEVDEQGPVGDRQWMLVNSEGQFLTQRQNPKISQVKPKYRGDICEFHFGSESFSLTRKETLRSISQVKIWSSELPALEEEVRFSKQLSTFLGQEVRLVRYFSGSQRKINSLNPEYSAETRFTDQRPILLINTASLEEINKHLSEPIDVLRFRSNIVIEPAAPFIEETWKRIQIGDVILSQPKLCTRCKIINIDQKTGIAKNSEPLEKVMELRKPVSGKANFGVHWIPENKSRISVGDPVKILE